MSIIDAHHHLWEPLRGDYVWMNGLPPKAERTLKRTYGVSDAQPIWDKCGIRKTIVVQAAPTAAETDYMLSIADECETIAGVIGWIDFQDPAQAKTLERFATHPKFKGVRPMVQDIADDDWILRSDIDWAFEALIEHDLIFEALGFPKHIEKFAKRFERHPELRIVLDHCLKPRIRDFPGDKSALADWKADMTTLARQTNAVCKFSALVTEANANWTVEDLRPFTDAVIEIFGAERLMWGSDWPVCLLAAQFEQWLDASKLLTASLSADEKHQIYYGTAQAVYRLESP